MKQASNWWLVSTDYKTFCVHCPRHVDPGFEFVAHMILEHPLYAKVQFGMVLEAANELGKYHPNDPRVDECITKALAWKLSQ